MRVFTVLFVLVGAIQANAKDSITTLESNDLDVVSPHSSSELNLGPATQSEYFYHASEGQTVANLSYSYITRDYSQADSLVNDRTKMYQFYLERGLPSDWSIRLGTGYASTDFDLDHGGTYASAGGLIDINLDASHVSEYDGFSAISGLTLTYSPASAVEASPSNPGNEFSGRTSFTPHIGLESTQGKSMIGANLWADIYTDRYVKTDHGEARIPKDDPRWSLEGFYEFPIYWKAKVGLAARVSRDQFVDDGSNRLINNYGASATIYVPVLDDTTITGSLSTDSMDQYFYQTNTEAKIGVRKTL